MKTCDVCKRTNGENSALKLGITSVLIGTDILVARAGQQRKTVVQCELCDDCNEKVNTYIAGHLLATFVLVIRR